jgi:hypothetical protein
MRPVDALRRLVDPLKQGYPSISENALRSEQAVRVDRDGWGIPVAVEG